MRSLQKESEVRTQLSLQAFSAGGAHQLLLKAIGTAILTPKALSLFALGCHTARLCAGYAMCPSVPREKPEVQGVFRPELQGV